MEPRPEEHLTIAPGNRTLATYICGNPGYGKSSLLQRMILRDIKDNRAVCVIDPTEQLVKAVIPHIPAQRMKEVVYFNTSLRIPIDFFSTNGANTNEVIDNLVNIINLGDAPTAKEYLANILTVFLIANRQLSPNDRNTIFDVPRFFTDESFRTLILKYCPPTLAQYFPPKYNNESVNALFTRMSKLARYEELQAIIGSKTQGINVGQLIDENKIVLIDLKENSEPDAIIGSVLASQIQHAIFSRAQMDDLRTAKPYALYIDEADVILDFAADRLNTILGRARKYNLWMTFACPSPLDFKHKEILDSLDKVGNLVLFNLTAKQAAIFKDKIAPHKPEDLTNLPGFRALFRTGNRVEIVETLKYLPKIHSGNAEYIRTHPFRTFGPDACKSAPVSHTSGDGTKPAPEPTLPHDAGKEPGTPAPQRVLRPHDKPARHATKRPDSN